jgi:hypothetical protein
MAVDTFDDFAPLQWFALRVKSNCERIVATAVRNQGFEEFLPLYRSRHPLRIPVPWATVPRVGTQAL